MRTLHIVRESYDDVTHVSTIEAICASKELAEKAAQKLRDPYKYHKSEFGPFYSLSKVKLYESEADLDELRG